MIIKRIEYGDVIIDCFCRMPIKFAEKLWRIFRDTQFIPPTLLTDL